MVKRIACFITCGYTEAGTMQAFLRKINDKYEYKQYLPNRTIKKKGDSKAISSKLSGLTGDALLEKIYEILKRNVCEISTCEALHGGIMLGKIKPDNVVKICNKFYARGFYDLRSL